MRAGQTDRRNHMQFAKDLRWEKQNPIPAAAAAASSLCKYIFYIFCLQKKEIDFFLLLNCSELIETPKL